ncbi:TPA: glucosamine-6-phosphate deaminase [Staphylococcus pseudintermedius]|uniref:glucosamine-6-phosphate deaminase n=1 Tax=Staphylococcus pseudintermedius TaxID=283734 RepID=UPI000E26F77C|nr:glucosamine-6-phosphate deaminase [Staphylococcus pseudintermedius]MBC8715171.1 glucosamine-6-phosphate deaminase [Staphylococcus pseudintermedius]REB05103.1 glucosamine-6-phosphate deaminase [Staphylococcus pseudintermedius]RYR82152.1 glucosamine-6-phosphate deaminase [Staphylococcus pseudintermedius]HAR5989712.1 glucosamine-6-phosphate deaminase [Staphylococcus pseudintermedius]HAR5994307.1 glucosamine-6-phosphate deaminase [Staphylococcus pseudintermedius]
MKIINLGREANASFYVASELFKQMLYQKDSRLGLATGGTMVKVYDYLVELLQKNQLDVSQVETFNLDEYVGLASDHEESYCQYMKHVLFGAYPHFTTENIHVPNGEASDIEAESQRYETLLEEGGPLDIQILGIGQNGHIGFNEPGTPFESLTHCVDLTESTIKANSRYFDSIDDVPKQAISMGLSSIMKAKRIILLAFGEQKREAIRHLMSQEVTTDVPATILHRHPHVEVYVDDAAMPEIDN